MPRPRRSSNEPIIPSAALVASATRYPSKTARIYNATSDWQRECYRHYSICGEARFAAKFFGNSVSRAVLKSAVMDGDDPVVQTSGPGYDALKSLFHGENGQSQMLEALGMHLTIAGECYLVGRTVDGVDLWQVISVMEMKVTGNGDNAKWSINFSDGGQPVQLTEKDVVIRVWLPNPGRQIEADSPFRSLLPILSEIEWLTRHVFAQISSRLAGAGILFLPQEMTFPPPPANADGSVPETSNDADAFMLTLADAMLTPLEDPGSPSALVPPIVIAPADAIDKAKLMHFWSDLDAASKDLRNEAIRRFALGMDLPPEQILGMSSSSGTGGGNSNGVSHWGAWQIEEATIKLHIEPMLEVICNAITMGYIRPLVDDDGASLVIYDSSALRLRPDRSKEAFMLYDRGLLKAQTLLEENGFGLDNMPDDDEFKRWLLVKIASGSATPEQVQAAVKALGVTLEIEPPHDIPSDTRQARPDPALGDPQRPRTPEESGLLAASEALVYRAMERAGNRLRQANGGKVVGVPAYDTHLHVKAGSASRLLEDAWSCAPQVLDGIADHTKIIPVLDSYCTTLLNEQAPHARARLKVALTLAEAGL